MIFISYAKEDAKKADRISSLLSEAGWSVFYDKKSLLPGMDWQAEIEEKLSACKLLLFLCTSSSVAKEGFVQKELRMALDRAEMMPEGKAFIIPVRFDCVKVPRKLARYQWIEINEDTDYYNLPFLIGAALGSVNPQAGSDPFRGKPFSRAILQEKVVLLLQGDNPEGDRIYAYLKIPLWKLQELKNAMDLGKSFSAGDFGTVLASGKGEPPADLRDRMAAEYNLVDIGYTGGGQKAGQQARDDAPLADQGARLETSAGQEILDQLLTEDLSGVTFVRDYLQLQFNPNPQINVYSKCSVTVGAHHAVFGEPAFANLIISCIGLQVVAVEDDLDAQRITISLERDARIEIPYSDGSYIGAEALYFQGRDERWGVWP